MMKLTLLLLPLGLDTFAVSAALRAGGLPKHQRLKTSLLLSKLNFTGPSRPVSTVSWETTMEEPENMNQKSTYWLAVAGFLVAMLALGIGIVAVIRAGDSSTTSAGGAGMSMSGSASMMEHMAAAPMEGVPAAVAARGGQLLSHTVDNGVWVFDLDAKPVRWEILPGTRVTAWTYNGIVPGPEIRVPYGQRVRIVV